MKKRSRYILVLFSVHLLITVALIYLPNGLDGGFMGLVLLVVLLFTELIAGLALCFTEDQKELGEALLLNVALFFVIGVAVCSG